MLSPLSIKLTNGGYTLVDYEDYQTYKDFGWLKNAKGYAVCARRDKVLKRNKFFRLHRLIMNTPPNMFTDHINGNKLDNRRSNLRVCTNQQNLMNKPVRSDSLTGIKGVRWHKRNQMWQARITHNGKCYYLGCFKDINQASECYQKAASTMFGEFAHAI